MLEVTFTQTMEDVESLCTFSLLRSAELRKRLTISWVVIPVGVCVIALVIWLAGVYPPLSIGVALGGVVVGVFFPLIRRSWITQWARQLARRNTEGGIGALTLTLTDDEFRVRGEVATTTARWEKMKGVVVGVDRTFIVVSDQMAVIVPRIAIGDDTAYAAVREFVAARLPSLA